MAVPLSLGPVHHLRLTVTDVQRSRAFYTELLGFQIAMDARHQLTIPTTTWLPTCCRTASSWPTASCCSGCAQWTPSGPATASTRFAVAWTI